MLLLSKFKTKFTKGRLLMLALFLFLVLIWFGLVREVGNQRKIDKEIAQLEKEISGLEKENGQLESFIADWQSGSRAEREARLKLGLKKPGETVIIISQDETLKETNNNQFETLSTASVVRRANKEQSNFNKWIKYFFN